MRKLITRSTFLIASLLVILIFVTAKTYYQLIVAVICYLPLAYFSLKIFPRKERKVPKISEKVQPLEVQKIENEKEDGIKDFDKRGFLKLIGAAGISFFLFSILNRKNVLFPSAPIPNGDGSTGIKDSSGQKVNPAERQPTDGYRISEIDDNVVSYYGFTNKDGAWIIMKEDSNDGSFRYAKGENGFSGSWSSRESLAYDYFYNVF